MNAGGAGAAGRGTVPRRATSTAGASAQEEERDGDARQMLIL